MTPTPVALDARLLALEILRPAPYNPRQTFEELEGLAKSITDHGVLEPLIVRRHPTQASSYEVVCGERRYRAAKLAGLVEVPCVVKDLDDDAARVVCSIENLQREDLDPLEEARGLQALLDEGNSPREVARELGKTTAYVARRAAIASLSKKWLDHLAQGDHLAEWGTLRLEVVVSLSTERQDELLLEYRDWTPDLGELRRYVDERLRELGSAKWDLEDAELVPEAGACYACSDHSGSRPGLFDEEPGNLADATCLNVTCWRSKLRATVLAKLAAAKDKHPDLVLIAGRGLGTVNPRRDPGHDLDLPRAALESYEWKKGKKGAEGVVAGFVVAGTGLGGIVWIRPEKRAPSGAQRAKPGTPKPKAGSAADLKERRARLKARRSAWFVDWAAKTIAEEKWRARPLELLVCLVSAYGGQQSGRWDWAERRKVLAALDHRKPTQAADVWAEQVVSQISDRLRRFSPAALADQDREAVTLLELLFQKTTVIGAGRELAAKAIPKPKILERLEAGPKKAKKKTTKKKAARKKPAAKKKTPKPKPKK